MTEISRSAQLAKRASEIVTPQDFGAKGDGVTDDTAAIQAAIDSFGDASNNYANWGTTSRGRVHFPEGTYIASGLKIPNYVDLEGEGEQVSILKLKDNTNTYLLASERYANNSIYVNLENRLEDLTFDGNKTNNTTGSLLIFRSFRSTFTRCTFQNSGKDGFLFSMVGADGATNSVGNAAECRWTDCTFVHNTFSGLRTNDNGQNKIADGKLYDNNFGANGNATYAAIHIDRCAGWSVQNNQVYDSGGHEIYMKNLARCHVTGNNIDPTGRLLSSGVAAGLVIDQASGDSGSVVANNMFWIDPPTSGSPSEVVGISILPFISNKILIASNTFGGDGTSTSPPTKAIKIDSSMSSANFNKIKFNLNAFDNITEVDAPHSVSDLIVDGTVTSDKLKVDTTTDIKALQIISSHNGSGATPDVSIERSEIHDGTTDTYHSIGNLNFVGKNATESGGAYSTGASSIEYGRIGVVANTHITGGETGRIAFNVYDHASAGLISPFNIYHNKVSASKDLEVTGTVTASSDIEVTDNTKGVILKSPNGSRFRLEVANDGTLSTEAL